MAFPPKLLGPSERLIVELRPHVKVLWRPLLVLLATAPITALIVGMMPSGSSQGTARFIIVLIALGVIAVWVAWPFLQWWYTIYAVTDMRLITRHGVLARSGHDMPLTRINDVKFSNSAVERLLSCGTLVVESGGESGQIVLPDIPKVENVQRILYELSERLRRQTPAVTRPERLRLKEDLDQYDEIDERDEHALPLRPPPQAIAAGPNDTMILDDVNDPDAYDWRT